MINLKSTTWALIIKERDYKKNSKMRSTYAFNNQIYELPAGIIVIIVWYTHHDDNMYWKEEAFVDTAFLRDFLFSQDGFCAEQKLMNTLKYSPLHAVTVPKTKRYIEFI